MLSIVTDPIALASTHTKELNFSPEFALMKDVFEFVLEKAKTTWIHPMLGLLGLL